VTRSWNGWAPAVLWAALIFWMSTDAMSAEHTAGWLAFLFPWASPEALRVLHGAVRKAAHVGEYFVLVLLLERAVRQQWEGPAASAAARALMIAVAYSLTDEAHQALVPSRGASPIDCLFDSAGAAAAWLLVRAAGNPLCRTERASPSALREARRA
jgi:VanZ family protein